MIMKPFRILCILSVCRFWLSLPSAGADPGPVVTSVVKQTTQAGKTTVTKETELEEGVRKRDAEIRRDVDGVVISRYGKVLRGNEVIFAYSWDKAYGQGGRSYYHSGKELLCEADEDGDGVSDLLIFFDSKHVPIEVFTRGKDGSVLPVSSQRLESIRRAYEAFDNVIGPAIDAFSGKATGSGSNNSRQTPDHGRGATDGKPTP